MSALAQVDLESPVSVALATAAPRLEDEALRPSEWATLLGLTDRAVQLRIKRLGLKTHVMRVPGGVANGIEFGTLPQDWRVKLEQKRDLCHCRNFASLLTVGDKWEPSLEVTEMTPHNRAKALAAKEAITLYCELLNRSVPEQQAVVKAQERWSFEAEQRNPDLVKHSHRPLQLNVSDRTIRGWKKNIDERGGYARAPLQAFGHNRQVEHINAQAETIHSRNVPPGVEPSDYDFKAFLKHFRARCVKDGMLQVDTAIESIDLAWKMGGAVPGLGTPARPGMEFPFTKAQLRPFAPSYAARKVGGQGKFRALADGVLPRLTLSSTELQLSERYILDDTRFDIAVKCETTGRIIELKVYFMMEESTRRIVAYTVRRAGTFRASDTAAIIARGLRSAGLAHSLAGYCTIVKVERGVVAMPKERKEMLEAMFPGRVKVETTGMVGGSNMPGDYVQTGKGAFWHKGKIEAFMKAFGFLTRWLPGQRGSDWRKAPAQVGDGGKNRVAGTLTYSPGSMLHEAALTAPAARLLAILDSQPDLSAYEAEQRAGFNPVILWEKDALAAIAAAVAYHNQKTGHQKEGFESIEIENRRGGRSWVTESPLMKWARLEAALAAAGTPLERISAADTAALLMTTKTVTVKPDGVKFDGFWYYDPHSRAIHEAQQLSTSRREMLALWDEADPSALYLLSNTANGYRRDGDELRGDAMFVEALPLYRQPQCNDPKEMARAAEHMRQQHNTIFGELQRAAQPIIEEQDKRRAGNAAKVVNALLSVVTTVAGEDKEAIVSRLSEALRASRVARPATTAQPVPPRPTPNTTEGALRVLREEDPHEGCVIVEDAATRAEQRAQAGDELNDAMDALRLLIESAGN